MEREQLVQRQTLFQGRLLTVHRDEVVFPDGRRSVREVVHHPGAVAVLPLLDEKRVILVRQYRHAIGRYLLEVPAGTREPHEFPQDCAARELLEETGYEARELHELLRFFVSPGWTDEELVVYVAQGLEWRGRSLAHDERLSTVELTLEEVVRAVEKREIVDAKTLLAVLSYFAKSR